MTDGEQRSALAVVRSLGAAGYRVMVLSRSGRSLAGASRWCSGEWSTPDPLQVPGQFVPAVENLVRTTGARLVIPITEASLLALVDSPLAGLLPCPGSAAVRRVCDKADVLRCAAELGIAVPEQVEIANASEVTEVAGPMVFPLVVKPSRSVGERGLQGGRVKLGVQHAADFGQLKAALSGLPQEAFPVLLQQRIVGPGVGVFLLRWDGRLLARFAHRRIREKPPSGGVSVYREGIEADPGLVAISNALLDKFSWKGVAMVEYKLDGRTGTPYLMEINGRFWGSLQLAVDSGVDFPRLLVERALGQDPSPVENYRLGIRSRWWWGDIDHLISMLTKSPAQLGLPPGSPGRLKALVDFLLLWRPGDRSEVLRIRDPKPFLRETALWLGAL